MGSHGETDLRGPPGRRELTEPGLRILFVGDDKPGSRAPQRRRAMRDMGHTVDFVRSHPEGETFETTPSIARRLRHRLRRPADTVGAGSELLRRVAAEERPDVIWIDYVLTIRPAVYREVRRAWPAARLVWYSEDDMFQAHNGSVWLDRSISAFDLWVTTKSFNARPEEMPARGARRVMFVNNTYDRDLHRPVPLDAGERERFGADASFVGTYESERGRALLALARSGVRTRVWGNGWEKMGETPPDLVLERRPVYGEELVRVYCASAVNLGFLRKLNRDLQTCRTIEIPACRGFLLHERNSEVRSILTEGEEAAFFADDEELIRQCRHWLDRPEERAAVGAAGWRRITAGGFSHHDRIAEILAAATGRNTTCGS